MANTHEGFKRIVFIISISLCIAVWIILFSIWDFNPCFNKLQKDAILFIDVKDSTASLDKINYKQIKQDISDFDTTAFKLMIIPNTDSIKMHNKIQIENLFEPHYPYTKWALAILSGFLSFIFVWLLWFIIIWVIKGFKTENTKSGIT